MYNQLSRGCVRVLVGLMLAGGMAQGAHAQALVVDGEEIASADLMAKAKAEGKIVIYSTLAERMFAPAKKAFIEDTGLEVEHINLITPRLYARATSEFTAGKLVADWVDTTDPLLTRELVKVGVLGRPHKVPSFDALPVGDRDSEGNWYTMFRTPIILGVNTAVVAEKDMPKSWNDILDPKWAGKIGTASIDGGGSWFHAFAYLRDEISEDYWKKLAAQKPKIYPSSAPMLADMLRGETSIAFNAPASIITQIEAGAPVTAIFPEEGASAYATTGGITTTAPHPHAAMLFVNWLTSKRGSTVIAESGIYGVHPDAPPPSHPVIKFPPISKLWSMDLEKWDKMRASYTTEWREAFGVK